MSTEQEREVIKVLETRIRIMKPVIEAIKKEADYARDERKISMLHSSFFMQYFHGADSLYHGLTCMEAALKALKSVGVNGVVGVDDKKTGT